MVLSDFFTETRRKWLKAFKLLKKSHRKNRVSPALVRSPTYGGAVDARSEITVQRFCACRASLPPRVEDTAYYGSNNSSCHSLQSVSEIRSSDSAYDSACSTPSRAPLRFAAVSYFRSPESDDSQSVATEYTLLEGDERDDETRQNLVNEERELVSSL